MNGWWKSIFHPGIWQWYPRKIKLRFFGGEECKGYGEIMLGYQPIYMLQILYPNCIFVEVTPVVPVLVREGKPGGPYRVWDGRTGRTWQVRSAGNLLCTLWTPLPWRPQTSSGCTSLRVGSEKMKPFCDVILHFCFQPVTPHVSEVQEQHNFVHTQIKV